MKNNQQAQSTASKYRCQFCIKRAIIQQGGLYLCAGHAKSEEPATVDLMPQAVFDKLYTGYGM